MSTYSQRMVESSETHGIRRKTRRMKMTNHTYIAIAVTSSSRTIIQSKVPFQIL